MINDSDNCTIQGNTLTSNEIGIEIISSSNITLSNNAMLSCGLIINEATAKTDMVSLKIATSNTANGKTIYYYIDKKGLKFRNRIVNIWEHHHLKEVL